MIRAIFFDFYTVWTPDKIGYYLEQAQLIGPEAYKQLSDLVENYYQGKVDINQLAETFRFELNQTDITSATFELHEKDISPEIIKFMRSLHEHFLKLGVLANTGIQELKLLNDFNLHSQIFEVIASPLAYKIALPLLSQEVFAKALNDIGEPPNNCLLASGSLPFLEFANNLGLAVVQFEGFSKLKESIDNLVASEIPD